MKQQVGIPAQWLMIPAMLEGEGSPLHPAKLLAVSLCMFAVLPFELHVSWAWVAL